MTCMLERFLNPGTVRLMGVTPSPLACDRASSSIHAGLLQLGVVTRRSPRGVPAAALVAAYAVCSVALIGMILRAVFLTRRNPKGQESRYPEADAWERGLVDWLWMGWATQWVSRWGVADSSAMTRVHAADLPLTHPDDEPLVNFERFQRLWREEVGRVGVANASLLKVVTRFVTYRKVFCMGAWNAVYEGFMFLGPPVAIKWVSKYLSWLYTQHALGVDVPAEALLEPTILLIVYFTGLPLLMAVSDSMCTMLNGRISVRIDGALSLAVYDKAQRLPIGHGDDDDDSAERAKEKKKLAQERGGHFQEQKSEEDLEFEETAPLEQEKLMANNYAPKKFNLVNVVTSDINVNIMGIPNKLARLVVMVPVCVTILAMLIAEIGWAVLFSIGMSLLNLLVMTMCGLLLKNCLAEFYGASGQRMQFLQQVLGSIRFVKGSGTEGPVLERLREIRSRELRHLARYYNVMCFIILLQQQYPKLYLLSSLGGHAFFHRGSFEPAIIIYLMPLLFSAQTAISVICTLVPDLLQGLPSCQRLEAFLKLEEAAHGRECPARGAQPAGPSPPVYRVQGSFAWRPGSGAAALTGLDVSVPRGKLVAIVGQVGAGKTTFLHAMLGELHPLADARVEVAERVAYAAQVPYLFEGSLRENVAWGVGAVDEARYKEALRSACLAPDLAVLPGGDGARVGSRGVALSGGQKARVSLARAAYDRADLVLLDDPFAAVDVEVGRHLDEHFLHGPLLRDRTRVVCCQPDSERLARTDWVMVLADGKVVAQGLPDDVMGCEHYKNLLSTHQYHAHATGEHIDEPRAGGEAPSGGTRAPEKAFELREDECQTSASFATLTYFARMGGCSKLQVCIAFFLIKIVLDMQADVQLSYWMTDSSSYDAGLAVTRPSAQHYLRDYIFFLVLSSVAFLFCWAGGCSWTIGMSRNCHAAITKALMRAPMDKFHDKTPLGRIMNRFSSDMMYVDMQVLFGCCSTIGMVFGLFVPLYYVHFRMPLWFTAMSAPLYYLVCMLVASYWRTMVPLRYLQQVSRSEVSSEMADVESSPASVRGYRMEEEQLRRFALAVRRMISAGFLGRVVCVRWLCNRLFVLGGCFATGLALLCVWAPPGTLDVGGAIFVINTVFGIAMSVEGTLRTGSGAQDQIIAMNRVHEYTSLPAEREEELPTDAAFMDAAVALPRSALGELTSSRLEEPGGGGLLVVRGGRGGSSVMLQQLPGSPTFVAGPGMVLGDLAPACDALQQMKPWHRITGVNGAYKQASDIADELCSGDSERLVLHIQSGWLADGVKLEIRDLRVGYAAIPRDVIQGISITIPRKTKAGIVGSTGCGKSTLFYALLRLLEPRGGGIYVESVDVQRLGLRTLRSALGFVPQDPVLLQGSLRYNIDPFEQYDDERIWEALRFVFFDAHVHKNLPGGLDFQIVGEGSNLSFGQRQLCCLARNMVRRPMLLLLDEATSAIDPHTQQLIQNTIEHAFPSSTMVVVAHRLETILNFDLIFVMCHGRIVEQGSIKDLANTRGGRFSRMLEARGLSV